MELQEKSLDNIAIENFIQYLKFPTVHPCPDYRPAVEWLIKQGKSLGLSIHIVEIVSNNPIVILCWKGYRPDLSSILLNSHMDVVPVDEAKWTRPPFGATIDDNGFIYARGCQDMKCVGIQQLEAVRRLKARGYLVPKRTVYISFVPDEELGGIRGMEPFVSGSKPINQPNLYSEYESIEFADMNIGLCLDEGIASPSDDYLGFYEERSPWWLKVSFSGNTGHGSSFIHNTSAEKLLRFITRYGYLYCYIF
ncbi:unnamed protein product [Protopolystoma xenopodis]|uniref:N-acyl-L-amino-acid amidohydrolase n=1 Tax=Protopolystoma xenopodis TaxID=117903 RepID=A0A3S5ABW9_9PLAT|nr:unnamed protein product [Protopolystoma xenopodis]